MNSELINPELVNSEPVSLQSFNQRKINLLPILIAQQLVLWPLYLYIPLWISLLNSLVVLVVYFACVKRSLIIPVWIKVIITLIAFAGVLFSFQRLTGRDAGVALIAIMYGLKILEIKSHRDVYVLMLLGFFILLAGFLFNQSPLIAIYQFIPVAAILNALTSVNSISSSNKLVDISTLSNIKKLGKYLVLALPIMVVLFVFFPRLSGPIWKMPGASTAHSGISDTMMPGEISSLQLSDKVAFRVKFLNNTPRGYEMYWRTLVLDMFDGLSWSRHPSKNKLVNPTNNSVSEIEINNSTTYEYDISLEKTNQRWLTMLDRPVETPKTARLYDDYAVQVRYRLTDRTRYTGKSQTNLVLNKQLTQADKDHHIALPEGGNPRSRSWAKQERQKYNSDREYIFGVLSLINQQEYFYTLTPPIMQRDMVDSFWFDHKKGFCEHYSGAFVFLARAAGIPARVVIGYQGAEKNPLSDYWIVRYADAHAWTEVWFEREGWVRVDPTAAIAPHRTEKSLRRDYSQRESLFDDFGFDAVNLEDLGLVKQFQYWMDQANAGWNDWILDYNNASQRRVFEGLGLEKLTSQQLSIFMITILAIFLSLISYKWIKQGGSAQPLQLAFERLNAQLTKHHIGISEAQGVYEIIKKLESSDHNTQHIQNIRPESVAEVVKLLKNYQFLRYANQQISQRQQKDFIRQVKALKIRTN